MLTITPDAAEAIRTVLSSPELPDGAGLRISTLPPSTDGQEPGFGVELAAGPAEDDEVLDEAGAHVFLAPGAAPALDDKLLDAQLQPGGELTFTLSQERPA